MVRYCKLNNTDRQNSSTGNPDFPLTIKAVPIDAAFIHP